MSHDIPADTQSHDLRLDLFPSATAMTSQLTQDITSTASMEWFRFLELPLEIRFMVYRLVLKSSSGAVIQVRHERAWSFRRFNPLPGPTPPVLDGNSLIHVNHKIHQEALQILREENVCVLVDSAHRPYGPDPLAVTALRYFPRIHLKLQTHRQFCCGDPKKALWMPYLGAKLLKIMSSNRGLRQLRIEDMSDCRHTFIFDEKRSNIVNFPSKGMRQLASMLQNCWYDAHTNHLVEHMRSELSSISPGVQVSMNSDAFWQETYALIQMFRAYPDIVNIKDDQRRRMGFIEAEFPTMICVKIRWYELPYDADACIESLEQHFLM